MAEEIKGMRPIWYFVGLILVSIGTIITIAGFYHLFNPEAANTVLSHLHPDLWWGLIMVISGGIFLWKNRGVSVT